VSDKPLVPVDPKRTGVKAVAVPAEAGEPKWFRLPGECEPATMPSHFRFACPGCGDNAAIRCTNPKEASSWLIEAGTLDKPETLTLHPSIHCKGCCGWHGWLKDGVFNIC